MVNVLKFQTLLFLFSTMLDITTGFHKVLFRIAKSGNLIRLLIPKQADLGLSFLSRPFWQAIIV